MKTKLAFAADHAGYEYKDKLIEVFTEKGYECIDCGTNGPESVDYPIFADKVCNLVSSGECRFGVLVCGTGIGMSIAANKHRGIRASLCVDAESTTLTRHHNDANVICMGARIISFEKAEEFAEIFFTTEFDGGRHQNRVDMLNSLI